VVAFDLVPVGKPVDVVLFAPLGDLVVGPAAEGDGLALDGDPVEVAFAGSEGAEFASDGVGGVEVFVVVLEPFDVSEAALELVVGAAEVPAGVREGFVERVGLGFLAADDLELDAGDVDGFFGVVEAWVGGDGDSWAAAGAVIAASAGVPVGLGGAAAAVSGEAALEDVRDLAWEAERGDELVDLAGSREPTQA
jgi:hypothetical protein